MAHSSVPRAVAPMASTTPASVGDVELEVRQRGVKPRKYSVPEAGFLIGSVAGCDLRVPGKDLPPVICMISATASGAELRRLAPMHPIQINGNSKAKGGLQHGDKLVLGEVEIEIHITALRTPAPPPVPTPTVSSPRPTVAVPARTAPARDSARGNDDE